MVKRTPVRTRRAGPADAAAICDAHGDSILMVASADYPSDVIADWAASSSPERVTSQIAEGVPFFIAVQSLPHQEDRILGFASHSTAGDGHHIAVYVRGTAARQGVGRAVYALAEAHARTQGATEIVVESATGAVPFWTTMGFESLGASEHQLRSGRAMACMRMRKTLSGS
jgi:putative acetyltransferase